MKLLAFAALPLVADASCTLKDLMPIGSLDVSCTVPAETQLSDQCCSTLQGILDRGAFTKALEHAMPATPADQAQVKQDCMSFAMYVMGKAQGVGQMPYPHPVTKEEKMRDFEKILRVLPEGLSCTEKVKGAGKTACGLHSHFKNYNERCEIPEATTITPQCCDTFQGKIDEWVKHPYKTTDQQGAQMMMGAFMSPACTSFKGYVMGQGASIMGKHPNPSSPMEKVEAILEAIPDGTSCKQAIGGASVASSVARDRMISALKLAADVSGEGEATEELNEPRQTSVVVAGGVGFAAGMSFVSVVFWYRRRSAAVLSESLLA